MIRQVQDAITPSKGGSLGKAFSRLGWWGFWLQIVFGSLPVILMIYYFAFSRSNTEVRQGLRFIEYLVIVDLLILLFTALWSWRYMKLGKRIADPTTRPAESTVVGTVWTGVIAASIGMFFSMVILFIEAANLLFYFLKAPQGGMPVIQTGADAVHWVSSIDMVSLMALILILFCELVVMVFSLWLLFRTTVGSAEYPKTVEL